MKKTTTTVALLLILSVLLVSLPETWIVKAQTIIYIKAGGSVEGTDKIQRDGDVYTFTGNIFNQSIFVDRQNIVVNGAGYTVQNVHGLVGLTVSCINVTIKNLIITKTEGMITGSDFGIFLKADNSILINNTISKNSIGIYVGSCVGHLMSGNTLTNNDQDAIKFSSYFRYSENTIIGNNITANGRGIGMSMGHEWRPNSGEGGNIIVENQVANNDVGMIFLWLGDYYSWKPNPFNMDNRIYANNFINNSQNIVNAHIIYDPDCANFWDIESQGNYWSDFNGTDNDNDGIGDTPYVIDGNNKDNIHL